jgi:broad-specificity NMP kinase
MKKILTLSGRPGTGKTTLFREFMKDYEWEEVEPVKLLPCHYCKELDLYILGKYEKGEVFAGTDRLSMAVGPVATEFVKSTKSNIMFEGDRLTSKKFFDALIELPNTEVKMIVISIPENVFKERYAERGSEQNETFLKGRETKISNILTNFDYMSYIEEFENKDLEDQTKILKCVKEFLN